MFLIGNGASIEFAEDLIAIARRQTVERVSEGARKDSPERPSHTPTAAKFRGNKRGSFGACEKTLARLFRIR